MAKAGPAKSKSATKVAPVAKLAVPSTWAAVTAIVALDDGRVIAGSEAGVALWAADGSLAWEAPLAAGKPITTITIAGALVAAHAEDTPTLFLLDLATGTARATHTAEGSWIRTIVISPSGKQAFVRLGNETAVYALPGFTLTKTLAEYVNESPIACTPRYLAVTGHEVHVFALPDLAHVATFEPEDSPFQLAWAPDGQLVTSGNRGTVGVFAADGTHVATHDSTPEKKAKKDGRALAVNAKHIAITRADSVVIVLDRARGREVTRFAKFEDAPVAFAPDGTLWIGAARFAVG